MDKAIVPREKIYELSADELCELNQAFIEATSTYEENTAVMRELEVNAEKLKDAGITYYNVSKKVESRINEIKAKGILGKVVE